MSGEQDVAAMREACAKACERFGKHYTVQWGDRKRFDQRDLQRIVRDVAKLCAEDCRAVPIATDTPTQVNEGDR